MIIEESFTVPARREAVAAFLSDVQRMSACVPGVVDVRHLDDDEYEATLRVRLGPIAAEFVGRASVDTTSAPSILRAVAQGSDSTTGSRVQVRFEAVLSEGDDGMATIVNSISNVSIRGRLGQFGSAVIASTAKSIVQEFAICAGKAVLNSTADLTDGASSGSTISVVRVTLRSVLLYLTSVVERLRRTFKREPRNRQR